MNKFLPLAIGIFVLISGCNSTPNYRKVSDSEIPNYNSVISNYKSGDYSSTWVQPINKSEKCEILFEGYSSTDSQPDIEWNGSCKNGKAEGLGKISATSGSVNYFEVTYHNKGVTDQLFYKWTEGTNQVQFGSYVHENNKMVKLLKNSATIKPNGDIDFVFSMMEENMVLPALVSQIVLLVTILQLMMVGQCIVLEALALPVHHL